MPKGHNIIILSDRGHTAHEAPIPALLAVSAVQHHLLGEGSRTKVSLVIESGEPREVHHFCLLIGYGASAINPYLAFETIHDQIRQGMLAGDAGEAEKRYVKAVNKGIVKVISKMGISTIQSYHGAQVFEALGLSQDFVDEYFTGTPTRLGGIGIDAVAKEVPPASLLGVPDAAGRPHDARHGRALPVPRRRRAAPVQPRDDPLPAGRLPHRRPASSTSATRS